MIKIIKNVQKLTDFLLSDKRFKFIFVTMNRLTSWLGLKDFLNFLIKRNPE